MLEEVNEYQYQLDRMMVQLARSGKVSKLVGVVVGHLTSIKQGDLKFDMDAIGIIKSHLKHLKIPIGFGFPIGHESPNLAVPFGVNAELTVTGTGSTLRLKY
jgi:muramoyltetrapeptide carboxypeptidase